MEAKKGRKKMWARIYWVLSRKSDVIPLTYIPDRNKRFEGAEVSLAWKDSKNVTSKHLARVVKIDCSKEVIESTLLDESGNVIQDGRKAVTPAVLLEKKKAQAEKKVAEISERQAQLAMQDQLNSATSLFHQEKSTTSRDSSKENEPLHSSNDVNLEERGGIFGPDHSDSDPDSGDDDDMIAEKPSNILPAFNALVPAVTLENIRFLETVLSAMKSVYESSNNKVFSEPNVTAVAEFKDSSGKVPVFEGAKLFLPQDRKNAIENSSTNVDIKTGAPVKNWKSLVRQVLIEIYGKSISFFCAKGRANSRPGIDRTVYAELLRYANFFCGSAVDEDQYQKFINTTASNKRPSTPGKNKGVKVPKQNSLPKKSQSEESADLGVAPLQEKVDNNVQVTSPPPVSVSDAQQHVVNDMSYGYPMYFGPESSSYLAHPGPAFPMNWSSSSC